MNGVGGNLYRTITACRACGGTDLTTVLDLGNLCVSDFPTQAGEPERAPLELVVCLDCSLVQLRHTVDRDRLYKGQYWYRSSVNPSMVAALRDVVDDACSRVKLLPGDKVLDIGANDGTLLRFYPQHVYREGFEPSNLGKEAEEGNDAIFPDYFPPVWTPPRLYSIITSIACFYDLDDPGAFVQGIKRFLHPDGIWVCQFQDLERMLACNGVDNICHEHLTYWSVGAFERLLARYGLEVRDVSHNTVNGGSVRYVVGHGQAAELPASKTLGSVASLWAFARQSEQLRAETVSLLRRLREQGKAVYGMGASTKANTLLQYYGIGPELITAFGERSPEKWGRQTVTGIPILSEREVLEARPDYLWIGPWHFLDNFRERYAAEFDGQWITPLPELAVVPGGEACAQSITVAPSARTLASIGSVTP
jgi:NDP-4-keto-2,6-dideoxyhexose 3-C-methyltransferase